MNILFCCNQGLENGLAMSVLSLLRQLKSSGEPLHIYVLTMNLSSMNIPDSQRLKPVSKAMMEQLDHKISKENGGFAKLIDCTELFINNLPIANMGTRFTPFCMLRLYADLLPEIPSKILYLDCDVICIKQPLEFYNTDISNVELAAVKDYYGRWVYSPLTNDYFNSGVLLMNMTKIRQTGLFGKCRKICSSKKMFLPDQHALNKKKSSVKLMDRRFNDQRRDHDDTIFRHFSTTWRFFPVPYTVTVKPWDEERMHKILKTTEYDPLINEYKLFMQI
jgi:lipopolysaccharide biosynthesis glycosyltransferase